MNYIFALFLLFITSRGYSQLLVINTIGRFYEMTKVCDLETQGQLKFYYNETQRTYLAVADSLIIEHITTEYDGTYETESSMTKIKSVKVFKILSTGEEYMDIINEYDMTYRFKEGVIEVLDRVSEEETVERILANNLEFSEKPIKEPPYISKLIEIVTGKPRVILR